MLQPYPVARLGIIGGGQLARMMIPPATRLGCEVTILDPAADCPAAALADHHIVAALDDADALRRLVEQSTVTTFDIEAVATAPLARLVDQGHVVWPQPSLLATIQDKLLQKQRYAEAGIPTAPFIDLEAPSAEALLEFGLPLVQKARRGGYDGRGVAVFRDIVHDEQILPVPSMVERYVDFRCELAVLVARAVDGTTSTYPVVEMAFDRQANILDLLIAPARIEPELAERARALAIDTVTALDGVGVFGVELFLTRDGQLLVNEVAPRTHNSGHWTMEACHTSQFEQHVRAVLGLPLGSTHQHSPAVMLNLLASPDARGEALISGLDRVLAEPGVAVHLYGKRLVTPHRKMGHLTITADTLEAALATAERVRGWLQITGTQS